MKSQVVQGVVETPSGREFEAECTLEACTPGGRIAEQGAVVIPNEHLAEFAMNPKGFHFKAHTGEAFVEDAGLYARAGGECIWEGRIKLLKMH